MHQYVRNLFFSPSHSNYPITIVLITPNYYTRFHSPMPDEQTPTSNNRMEDVDDSIQAYLYGNASPLTSHPSYSLDHDHDPDLEQHGPAKWVHPVPGMPLSPNIGSSSAFSGSSTPVSSLPSYPTNASATLHPLDPTTITNGLEISKDWFYSHSLTFSPLRRNVGHERDTPNGVPFGSQSSRLSMFPGYIKSSNSQEFGTMPPRCHDLPLGWVNPGGVQPLQTPSVNEPQRSQPFITPQQFNGPINGVLELASYSPGTTKTNGPRDGGYGENTRLSSDTITIFSPVEGDRDRTSEGSSVIGSLPGSDTAFSNDDRYTDAREHQFDANNEGLANRVSSSRPVVAHHFGRQSFAPGESPTRYRPPHTRNNRSLGSNTHAPHSPRLHSHGADAAQQYCEPRFEVPGRPTHKHPSRPSSDPQPIALRPLFTANASLDSYPFAQPGPMYPLDGDHGRTITGFHQAAYFNSANQTSFVFPSTDGRPFVLSAADGFSYGSAQPDAISSQPADSSNTIAGPTNLMTPSELKPMDSTSIHRVKERLPSHAQACFRHSRPEDNQQLICAKLLHVLSIDAASLSQYDEIEITDLLQSRCGKRLCAVERNGTKGGVTCITCLVDNCKQKFDKHNVSRNFAHHVMKMHWKLNVFICHDANCDASFSWPGDRTRHEKDQHNLIYG